jgi:3-deoxy-7-phosphoheptulonate synthase
VDLLRGGAYKPRTSPNSFQGLEEEGIDILKKVSEKNNIPIITEIMSIEQLKKHHQQIDIIQVGARNMYNYPLLKEIGKIGKPVMLKRAFSATLDEFISAAKYISNEGNENIILCERGIRTFETAYRNVLDINAIIYLKQNTPYLVFADPSHGSGDWKMVSPLAKAAKAAGADGIMIEVHDEPENAKSDGGQSLKLDTFKELIEEL